MRIKKFWAKGYRSLRDVTLEGLGTFNVFYGPNGSGKSNLLAGMRALFQIAGTLGPPVEHGGQLALFGDDPGFRAVAKSDPSVLRPRDFNLRSGNEPIFLGAEIDNERGQLTLGESGAAPQHVVFEVRIPFSARPRAEVTRLELDGTSALPLSVAQWLDASLLFKSLSNDGFGLVEAIRTLQREVDRSGKSNQPRSLLEELNAGRLASALFAAKNATSPWLRKRFQALQGLLEAEPLRRPPFDVFREVTTHEVAIRELLSTSPDEEREVPLDLAGLGVVQLYTILAKVLFSGADIVGIEEPEAHLHSPTSGIHLRQLLARLVDEGHVDQLMIATHSNLFDLDPEGYWDVSLVDGATVVERKPLHEIDARHLYEPGPAKHALQQLLRYAPGDEVVFRRPDSSPVSAGEMLRLLQEDAPVAVDFLRNLHGAALRVLRLDQRRGASK